MPFLFDPPPVPSLPVTGSDARFPVHRIYCIGRNYAEHAKEMGSQPVGRANPVFFMKPADAIVPEGGDVPYPSATQDLHHEVEMIVGLHAGGRDLDAKHALDCVFGYGVGLDLTRRDLQAAMKAKGLPWDVAKGFDGSAPVSALRAAAEIGHPAHAKLSLTVNGETRQDADIADMIFPVADIVAELSKLFELKPGDLIFTGTPAGVGPLVRGDTFRAVLQDIAALEGSIV
ncbi:MAG TPA: fumarylacetoacetate hydrolase family protein [Rhodanobacteraceae bacterium]|nr:fumarylacetoacetate hydrolase family protein [Rhodanobacteraceae bacterium]